MDTRGRHGRGGGSGPPPRDPTPPPPPPPPPLDPMQQLLAAMMAVQQHQADQTAAILQTMQQQQVAAQQQQAAAQQQQTAILQAMQEQTITMLGIVQQLGQLGAQGFPQGVSDLKRFKDTGPTTFSGSGGSIQAEERLRRTEELLVAAEITPARKVEIVRLELTDLARQWWATEADSIIPRPIP